MNAICSKYDVILIILLWVIIVLMIGRLAVWQRWTDTQEIRWMGSDDNAETSVARHCARCDRNAIYEQQLEPWRQISSASVAIIMAENNGDSLLRDCWRKIISCFVSVFCWNVIGGNLNTRLGRSKCTHIVTILADLQSANDKFLRSLVGNA